MQTQTCPAPSVLLLTPMPGTNRYQVAAPWAAKFPAVAGISGLRVPARFETDGASIPRQLWRAVGHPFTPGYVHAAVVHDRLYRTQEVNRKTADQIFRAILLADGVPKARAEIMYRAVRWFGWVPWNKRAKAKRG